MASGHDDQSEQVSDLVRACKAFAAADEELDRMAAVDPGNPAGLAAHRRLREACASISKLPASDSAGQQLKARVLISVLTLVCGGFDGLELHEQLALSLARDLLSGGSI